MANNRELSQFASLITVDNSTRTLGVNTSIYVSGVSTFVGIGTFNDDLYVQDKLYVGGIEINAGGSSIGTDITTRNLQVTGIATVNSNLIVNGNLGIGTTNPSSKLHVVGDTLVTGVSTIVANSSTDALRITQLGSGNALVVEDETSPDSTPFVVTATGNLGIGIANPAYKLFIGDYNQNSNVYSMFASRSSTDFSSGVVIGLNYGSKYTTSQTSYASGFNVVAAAVVAAGVTNSGYIRAGVENVWRNSNAGSGSDASTDNGTLNALYGRSTSFGHYNDYAVSPITNIVTGMQLTPYALTGSIGTLTGVNVSSVVTAVGATATNVYGLRSQIATNDGTNPYNLYIDGAAKNYIAGNLGIGTTNPQSQLHITGQFQSTQANSTADGGGQIYLNGATGNRIDFNVYGYAAPTFSTRSVGTKIVFYPNITASSSDWAVGIDTGTLWHSVSRTVDQFKWYAGIATVATLSGTGNLTVTGQFQSTQANSTTTGGGQIYLNGATGNRIDFNSNGYAAPTTTTRSVGTKIVLYPNVDVSGVDFAVGIDNNTFWSSAYNSTSTFKWYAGTTNIASLFGTGQLALGTTSLTGTTSQLLQVTGGAYVSGNLGVGVTNPTAILDVGNSATTNFTAIFGADANASTRTDATDKVSRIGIPHYTNSEEPAAILFAQSGSSFNTLTFGGGTALMNAANFIDFYTASNNTTTSGTRALRIDNSQRVAIGTDVIGARLHVVPSSNAPAGLFSGTTSSDMVRITQTGTGNAFVVEDATNPDATPFVIMADGKVGVGTTGMIQYGSGVSDTSTFGILASTGNDSAFVLKGNNGSTTDGSGQTLAITVGANGGSGSATNLIHYSHNTSGIGTRRNSIRFTDTQIRFEDNVSGSVDVTINSSGSGELLVGRTSSTGTSNQLLQVQGGAYILDSVGIGTTNPTSKLHVIGDTLVTGVVTATTFIGAFTGIAASATQLVTPRTFEITGDVVASAISFDGTGNVSLAATIQPNSVGLGTDTTGDYVRDITGTTNQITVTSGTGESSTPTLSIPNQFTPPQDVTVTRDLQVNRNLNVNGNITIGGSSATIFTNELKVYDPDIVLGIRTDGSGNDISNDTTANHGGIAIASTEGTPLITLYNAGIGETNPATYKKIMWFKSGSFTGLNTDAWLINYAVGIGSTQFPSGTRLAAGSVQFTQNDLAVVGNINASGITTSSRITLNGANSTTDGGGQIYLNGATGNRIDFNTNGTAAPSFTTRSVGTKIVLYPTNLSAQVDYAFGIESQTLWSSVPLSTNQFKWYAGTTNIATLFGTGELVIGSTTTTGTASQPLQVTGGAYVSGNLGIGATNPLAKLDSRGTVLIATTASGNNILAFGNTGYLGGTLSGAPDSSYGSSFILGNHSNTSGAPSYLSFWTTSSGVVVERERIHSTGEISIGSTTTTGTASQPLQVTGGAYVSGNLGIGRTNPQVKLEVLGGASLYSTNTAAVASISASNTGVFDITSYFATGGAIRFVLADSGGTNTERARFDSSGNLGIGTTNPSSKLTVVGNAYITGVTTSTDFDSLSDINLKTNINQIADPLEKVMQIRGVTFNWKEDNRNSAGVIAQEIEKVLPELVHGGETKTVNYNGLIGLLIECVKKQQEEIDELKRKVN